MQYLIALAVILFFAQNLFAQGLQYTPPAIPGFEPPFTPIQGSPFNDSGAAILKTNTKMFKDTAVINFEGRQITFSRADTAGNSVWMYHYGELGDYVSDRRVRSFYEEWYNQLTDEKRRMLPPPAPPRLQWELSVNYPPWARRLLGNVPPRLRAEGRLQMTAAYERTSIRAHKGDDPMVSTNPLDLDLEYEFSISGSVGRLISVNISMSRHDDFSITEDWWRNFKVEYKEAEPGELEDEIIQEIVIGYTGFDMPGTTLSGYSEKADGLFGMKVRAKLGPLMLTGVASQAQGEALSIELGGRNDPNATAPLRENDFIRNRYFYLTQGYKEYYNRAQRPPERVVDFQAFILVQNCNDVSGTSARCFNSEIDGNVSSFRMLEENKDYIIDRDWGIVRFEHNIRDIDIVAIALNSTGNSPRFNVGTIAPINAPNGSTLNLGVLKPQGMESMSADDPNYGEHFGLMWRNVYFLSAIDDALFDIFYLDPDIGDTIRHIDGRLISNILGITDEQGRARADNVEIFNLARQEMIFPLWGSGLNGNDPFANPALGDMADASIYRFGPSFNQQQVMNMNNYVPKFGIVTGGATRRTSYDNLGWNILPGTVTVKTNTGVTLIEGEDYELDYTMGILDLLSARARAAESITVTLQRESDFVLDRKIFAGLRGELKLPFISDNSFMAASVLYQNVTTSSDDIPMLGTEPYSKLHLSFNTSLDFEPEWMTRAVNYLPFMNTEMSSAAKVDFEIVQSRMNPNTSRDRSAYIENFDRTKDGHSPSLRHTMWHPSHFPYPYEGGVSGIGSEMLRTGRVPAWQFYWFTPNSHDNANRVSNFSVWQRDRNSRNTSDMYIDVLRMRATPAHSQVPERFANSYASITTSFGRNGLNMENHRYLEMVINPVGPMGVPSASRGKLMIQIGTFSHDQVRDGGPPNGRFDLEDTTYQNRPEQLPQFDRGLNWREADAHGGKFYLIPNAGAGSATGWDTLSATQNTEMLIAPRSVTNPSGDRFQRYDRDNTTTFRSVNGTWGNSLFDNENIDNDGVPRINIREQYYTYEIDLDNIDDSPYLDKTARVVESNGWRFLRIPLKEILEGVVIEKDSVNGGADWSRVRGMRLVWHEFDNRFLTVENEIQIASLELVGNHWEARAGDESKIEPTSINNFEDSEYWESVYNFIVRPKAGEATPEDGSLRLNFKNLTYGDTVLATRNLSYSPPDVSGYDSLSILVHSREAFGEELRFVLRFGSNDSTFYEYNAPITAAGWNTYKFSLQDFSDLKDFADISDSAIIDEVRGNLRVVAPFGRRPNFTSITYLAVGVANTGGMIEEGEIWVNEFKGVGARKLTGVAARLNVTTQWADFLSLAFGGGYTSGNFRTMSESTMGGGNSEVFMNASGKMDLHKFLPEEWGVSLPVGGSVSGTLSRPTVKPQSDVLLLNDNGNPDGFLDMAGDALSYMFGGERESGNDATRAQRYETFTSTRNLFASFEKESESQNPLINFTLDRMKIDVSYNVTTSMTARGRHFDPDSADFIRTDTSQTFAGNLQYDLSPRNPPSWTTSTPFEEVSWLPGIYRKYKINLLPSTIMLDLAEMQHRVERRNDPRLNVHNFETRSLDMRHGARITYAPIDPLLTFAYTIRYDRDLSDLLVEDGWESFRDNTLPGIFSLSQAEDEMWDMYGILYGERGRTQTGSVRFAPQFVTWMTHSAEYSASYTGQLTSRDNETTQFLNAGVGTALRFRNSLLVADLFKKFAAPPAPAAKKEDGDTTESEAVRKTFMQSLNDGITKINLRNINFEYEVGTDLRNSFLSSTFLADTMGMSSFDLFMYQMGLRRGDLGDYLRGSVGSDGLGYMFYREELGVPHDLYRYDQSRGSWTTRFSTAFVIPEPIRINITNLSYGFGREFYAQPDTAFIDTTVTLPEIRVSANTDALMKLSFVKRYMSRLALTSAASYKVSRKESRERTDTTTSLELTPLVSLDGKVIRWPALSANYRYGRTSTNIVQATKGDSAGVISTENTGRGTHTLTLAYEFSNTMGLQDIRLGRWVIPIQGKTNIGITIHRDGTITRIRRIGDDDDVITRTSELTYSPFIDYRFTDNIRGQARYLGSHKNDNGRLTNQQRFELAVEVTF